MPDELVILEITTGRQREIIFNDGEGNTEGILPYAKSSPAGLLIEALVKMCRVQMETSPPDPRTKVSRIQGV